MAENRTFSGGFRTSSRPVANSDRRPKNVDRSLGSSAPIPLSKKTPIASEASDLTNFQELRRNHPIPGATNRSSQITNVADKVPLSKQNAEFASNFARESKALATKRGLTGAQRRAQLGALTTSFKLQSAGIADDDPRAVAIRGLGDAANERGLSGLQRRLQTSSANTLLSDTLSDEKTRPLTFDEQLDAALERFK